MGSPPLVEELFKGLFVGYLLWRRRVGFIVDAAIYAFAVGTAFAVVENLYFLKTLAAGQPLVWWETCWRLFTCISSWP